MPYAVISLMLDFNQLAMNIEPSDGRNEQLM